MVGLIFFLILEDARLTVGSLIWDYDYDKRETNVAVSLSASAFHKALEKAHFSIWAEKSNVCIQYLATFLEDRQTCQLW